MGDEKTVNDVLIEGLRKDLDETSDLIKDKDTGLSAVNKNVSDIRKDFKWVKYIVTGLVVWIAVNFMTQTSDNFKEIKAELVSMEEEHRADTVRFQEQLNALALAAVKQNNESTKPFEIKEYIRSFMDEDYEVEVIESAEWEDEDDIMDVLKKSFDDTDIKKLEELSNQQQMIIEE